MPKMSTPPPSLDKEDDAVVTDEQTDETASLSVMRAAKRRIPRLQRSSAKKVAAEAVEEEEMDKEADMIDDDLAAFIAETGCPIYGSDKFTPEEIAAVLLSPESIDTDKVCFRIPPSCPGVGMWLFVISLEHVDPDDISCDLLGKYLRPSGRKHFFQSTDEGFKKLPEKHGGMDYDYVVRANRYTHGDPDKGNQFHKLTFLAYNKDNDLLGPYGIIQYQANVDPSSLQQMPHSNAKNDKPLIRTKPSAIKQTKNLLLSQTPREVMETLSAAQAITGEGDPSDIPRGLQSVSAMVSRTPGAMRSRRGRPRGQPQRSARSYSTPQDDDDGGQDASYGIGLSRVSTTRPRIDALHIQMLAAKKRKQEMEMDKIELEKDKLELEKDKLLSEREKFMSERDKLDSENEMLKVNTEKLRVELDMLRAKKYKMDMEMTGEQEENVVVVQEDMHYRDTYH